MEKVHNLVASVTGREKVGFIDWSQDSLYSWCSHPLNT